MPQSNPKLIDLEMALKAGESGGDMAATEMRKLVNELQQSVYSLRQRLELVEGERDQLSQQVDALKGGRAEPSAAAVLAGSPNDPIRLQNLELSRMADGLRRALTESEKSLQAAQSQIASLRLARDAAQNQTRELQLKMEQSENEIADLRDLLESGAGGAGAGQDLSGNALAEAQRGRTQAEAALEASQKRLQELTIERDALIEKTARAEMEVDTLRERVAALEVAQSLPRPGESAEELEMLRAENEELTARLEAQRLETIDLATRFQATQEQIKSVSASLAEARLMAKAAARGNTATPAGGAVTSVAPVEAAPVPAPVEAPETFAFAPTEAAMPAEEFSTAHAQSTLREMRRCYQAFAREPEDLSHLNELSCLALSFAEQTGAAGFIAINRIAGGLATLVQELYHYPDQLNNEVLTTVVQAIEFLSTGLKLRDPRQLRDPSEMTVAIVDDDAATCECILMAMESVNLPADSFRDPAKALCELSNTPVDLIVLDVQMPGMDGFELCTALRQQSHHQHTPVLFVTGQTDPEVRARAALSGGNDFMTKPFLLCELSLKALVLGAKAQLHMV